MRPPKGVFMDTTTIILIVLLASSEALASIPAIKANSFFQIVSNAIKFVVGKK